jgi:hypothetical protein
MVATWAPGRLNGWHISHNICFPGKNVKFIASHGEQPKARLSSKTPPWREVLGQPGCAADQALGKDGLSSGAPTPRGGSVLR